MTFTEDKPEGVRASCDGWRFYRLESYATPHRVLFQTFESRDLMRVDPWVVLTTLLVGKDSIFKSYEFGSSAFGATGNVVRILGIEVETPRRRLIELEVDASTYEVRSITLKHVDDLDRKIVVGPVVQGRQQSRATFVIAP
jgi:hypothetical protein